MSVSARCVWTAPSHAEVSRSSVGSPSGGAAPSSARSSLSRTHVDSSPTVITVEYTTPRSSPAASTQPESSGTSTIRWSRGLVWAVADRVAHPATIALPSRTNLGSIRERLLKSGASEECCQCLGGPGKDQEFANASSANPARDCEPILPRRVEDADVAPAPGRACPRRLPERSARKNAARSSGRRSMDGDCSGRISRRRRRPTRG
jgi:hypothetical protein